MSAEPHITISRVDVVIGKSVETHLHAISNDSVMARVQLRHAKATSGFSLLYVCPEYRGLGLGRLLVKECERLARENGRISINLLVNRGNESVNDFYRKLGYVPVFEWEDGDTLLAKKLEAA